MSFVPDEALVDVSVLTTNKTAVGATQTNALVTAKVIKALNGIGISNDSLRTQGYNLYPNYNYYAYPSSPSIMSYSVTNTLEVNLTSDDPSRLGLRAGQVIDTAVGAGANQVYLQFSASKSLQAKVNTEALQQAVFAAGSKAKTIADALGVTISGVISVTEGYSSYSPYNYQSYGGYTTTFTALPAATTVILPGNQIASASVQVVYLIT